MASITINSHLDADLASGYAAKVVGLGRCEGALVATVVTSEGGVFHYLSQNDMLRAGEIAHEVGCCR